MLLDTYFAPQRPGAFKGPWQVQLADRSVVTIEGTKLETDGGALVITGTRGQFVVAFGPGAWLEVQRP